MLWHAHDGEEGKQAAAKSSTSCFTDSELQTYFIASKLVTVARPVQPFIGNLSPGPTPICEDSKPTIAIIQSSNIMPRARHNGSCYAYSHEQYMNETSEPIYISTSLQPADVGTKALPKLSGQICSNY